MTVNIVCMKWGDKYGPDYVNKLYDMVSKNLTKNFRFICFTDNKSGIKNNVDILPLPFIEMPKNKPERGWRKLSILQKNISGLDGISLFLDLDVVLVDNIDPLFDLKGEFFIAFDKRKRSSSIGNSSVFRFKAGEHDDIFQNFNHNSLKILQEYRNEQAYLSDMIKNKGIFQYWPKTWCPSFKYHCVPQFPLNFFSAPKIPKGAKVILFHGLPEPNDAAEGRSGKWYRYIRKSPWITKHWKIS
jgi:hypothetical protein